MCAQAMIPFDEAELAHIASLDARADVDMLRTELPSLHEGCLRMLELGTLLLQMCAQRPLPSPTLSFLWLDLHMFETLRCSATCARNFASVHSHLLAFIDNRMSCVVLLQKEATAGMQRH